MPRKWTHHSLNVNIVQRRYLHVAVWVVHEPSISTTRHSVCDLHGGWMLIGSGISAITADQHIQEVSTCQRSNLNRAARSQTTHQVLLLQHCMFSCLDVHRRGVHHPVFSGWQVFSCRLQRRSNSCAYSVTTVSGCNYKIAIIGLQCSDGCCSLCNQRWR